MLACAARQTTRRDRFRSGVDHPRGADPPGSVTQRLGRASRPVPPNGQLRGAGGTESKPGYLAADCRCPRHSVGYLDSTRAAGGFQPDSQVSLARCVEPGSPEFGPRISRMTRMGKDCSSWRDAGGRCFAELNANGVPSSSPGLVRSAYPG